MYTLGEMYQYGEDGKIDFVKSRHYFEQAAKLGHPGSQV